MRGTFAGRYVDVDERGDVIGKRTAERALTRAVAGAFFGPPGFAVGLSPEAPPVAWMKPLTSRIFTTHSSTRSVRRFR